MAKSQARQFSSSNHTFLTKRFDRTADHSRLHFASAMTLLGYTDGNDSQDGVSYLELVEFLSSNGAKVTENLHQLYRRIVFNMCVSNTDDHLRNHGFVLTPSGWELSPAYDINPIEHSYGLKLNVSEDDNALDLDLARSVAPYFRLERDQVEQIISEIKVAVAPWKSLAEEVGISRNEIELKASAFRLVDDE
jgi:serine/threonine-protein kinase HipA